MTCSDKNKIDIDNILLDIQNLYNQKTPPQQQNYKTPKKYKNTYKHKKSY